MSAWLGALAVMTSASTSGGAVSQPIELVIKSVDQGIRVQVVGATDTAYEATFLLEVTSDGNRSIHQGSANIQNQSPVVLSTVSLAKAAVGRWRARLVVEPRGGKGYEQVSTEL